MPSRTRKFRGLRTHGRGIKAGRGAGKQGGRGNAGLHKYKFKSMLIYAPDHFGRHGFKRPTQIVANPTSLNVGDLEGFVPSLVAAEALRRDGDTFVADLAKAGVDRLLGGGSVARTWKVYVPHASKHAREKVTVLKGPPGGAPESTASSGP
ncbi:MAG TPA: uL15 family ribosomal protein [Thermoplasmata archaeon]|nr:uL15 family ribosomal protein [Thermoplasmata archaeon]